MRSEGPTPNIFPSPESLRPTLVGDRYMVSAGHPIVAQVAALVLERGGNAVDAGVAGGLAANVVMADMCNLGGVAPILVRTAGSHNVWSVAGLGCWGAEATLEAFRSRFGNEMPLGCGAAVVPGAPAAWAAALERFGTWSFANVAAPAIELAADGFVLDLRTAFALELFGGEWETTKAVYWPENSAPRVGDRLRQPRLAELLERLAAAPDARRAFYEGDVAERIVEFVRADGGWLSRDDMAPVAPRSSSHPRTSPAGACTQHRHGLRGRRCSRRSPFSTASISRCLATTARSTCTSWRRRSSSRSRIASASTAIRASSTCRSSGCSRTGTPRSCGRAWASGRCRTCRRCRPPRPMPAAATTRPIFALSTPMATPSRRRRATRSTAGRLCRSWASSSLLAASKADSIRSIRPRSGRVADHG